MALLLEAFYGGSHKQLVDLLQHSFDFCKLYTLPAKKFPWRMRSSAVYFADAVEAHPECRVLFASSVVNLSELCGLRPDLAKLRKVLYFHENQLAYPVRKSSDCDFTLGYTQIVSCLAADMVVFNSHYNMESFLSKVNSHIRLSHLRMTSVRDRIGEKSHVLYFPLDFSQLSNPAADSDTAASSGADATCTGPPLLSSPLPSLDAGVVHKQTSDCNSTPAQEGSGTSPLLACDLVPSQPVSKYKPLHIVWPHRWEHDKNPDLFFEALKVLVDEGQKFFISVVGETFDTSPAVFEASREMLGGHVRNWGFVESRAEYIKLLQSADVVVSTSDHEFFGVAMLEAVYCGCYPVCPNRLVYPEIFPKECLYATKAQLVKKLRSFCKFPHLVKQMPEIDMTRFDWNKTLQAAYSDLLSGKEPMWSTPR